MLLGLRSDGDFYAIERTVIRSISSAEDEGVGLFFFRLFLACSYAGREERQKHTHCKTRGRVPAPARFNSHRLRLLRRPRLRPHPRPARPPDSIQAGAW